MASYIYAYTGSHELLAIQKTTENKHMYVRHKLYELPAVQHSHLFASFVSLCTCVVYTLCMGLVLFQLSAPCNLRELPLST